MGDRTDQRDLPIPPTCPLDPGAFRRPAFAAITSHQQPPTHHGARRQRDLNAAAIALLRNNGFARHLGDQRFTFHGIQKGAAQIAIFDHVPHRAFFNLGVVKMQTEQTAALPRMAIRHLDFQHRLGRFCHVFPNADGPEQSNRRKGQRIGASVESRDLARGQWQRINHSHRKPRLGKPKRQRRPVQPAAHDHDVTVPVHGHLRSRHYAPAGGIVHAPG